MPTKAPSAESQNGERLSDRALSTLMSMIISGRLTPGSRLPSERDLSQQLGVSRVTLRDAVKQLEAKGFIESRSKSGHYVKTVIPKDFRQPIEESVDKNLVRFSDIIELRRILETWAVERAADRADSEQLAALETCLEAMRRESRLQTDQQFARYGEADLRFHQILASMSGNPLYVHLIDFLGTLITRSIALTRELMPNDFAQANLTVHERIVDALKRRDPPAARAAMIDHFDFAERQLGPKHAIPTDTEHPPD